MIRLILIYLLLSCPALSAATFVIDDNFEQQSILSPLPTAVGQSGMSAKEALFSKTFSTALYQDSTKPNPNRYWHKLDISAHTLTKVQPLVLLSQNHILQHLDIYLFIDGELIQSKQLGINDRPINQESYLDAVFDFDIEPGTQLTLLISKQTDGPSILPIKLMSDQAYQIYSDQIRLFWGIIIGTFFSLAIYNCVIYALNLNSTQYAWYLLFQLILFFQFAALHGFGYLILPDEFCRWLAKHMGVLHLVLLWAALMFGKHFLDIKKFRPKLYSTVENAKWIFPILLLLSFFLSEQQRMFITSALIIPVSYICISTAYIALRTGYTPAFSYLLSWVCTFVGATTGLLTYANLLPQNIITMHSFIIGSLAELYLLSVGLAKRLHHQELLEKQHRSIDHSLNLPNQHFYQHALSDIFNKEGLNKSQIRLLLIYTEGVDNLVGMLGSEAIFSAKRTLLERISADISELPWHISIDIPLDKRYFGIAMPPDQTLVFVSKSISLPSQVEVISSIWQRHITKTEYFADLNIKIASAEIDESEEVNELHQKAYMAIIEAQKQGVQWLPFSKEMSESTTRRVELIHDLKIAIENHQLDLHIQPQIDIASRIVVGGEALMRWEHPMRGTISPAVFIPLAEQSGQIHALTRMAIEKMFAWMSAHKAPIKLSINISVMDLRHHDFVQFLYLASQKYNVSPKRFALEITESQELESSNEVIEKLANLNQMGFTIALDDFGTGYSSMAYLSKLHIDEVKIDRIFIKEIHHSATNQAIVKTLVSMAETLGAKTVIEGIESEEELTIVKQLGGAIGQGFYWSAAIPTERFEQRYLEPSKDVKKVKAKSYTNRTN